jgi:hypothetical protein
LASSPYFCSKANRASLFYYRKPTLRYRTSCNVDTLQVTSERDVVKSSTIWRVQNVRPTTLAAHKCTDQKWSLGTKPQRCINQWFRDGYLGQYDDRGLAYCCMYLSPPPTNPYLVRQTSLRFRRNSVYADCGCFLIFFTFFRLQPPHYRRPSSKEIIFA